MALTPLQDGQTTPNRPETNNASKQAFSQTVVSGTAFQISTVQESTVYLDITTSAAIAIAIGPTAAAANTVLASEAAPIGLMTLHVPAGWYLKITGTPADFTCLAILN